MGDFKHPLGNFKVQFLKGVANLFSLVSQSFREHKTTNEQLITSRILKPSKLELNGILPPSGEICLMLTIKTISL